MKILWWIYQLNRFILLCLKLLFRKKVSSNYWASKTKTKLQVRMVFLQKSKLFAAQLAPALTHIFNKSLTTGILPEDWLSANISPIFRKGDRATAANYRPVSLTPICCKLFEHILHSNIMRHFSEHQVLTDRQHGFRANHSCESQLVLTVNDLAKSIDAKTPVDMIIMDFSKAFDTVPHNRLLHKLQNFGTTGRTHTCISNFLTKRRQELSWMVIIHSGCMLDLAFPKAPSSAPFCS